MEIYWHSKVNPDVSLYFSFPVSPLPVFCFPVWVLHEGVSHRKSHIFVHLVGSSKIQLFKFSTLGQLHKINYDAVGMMFP